VCVCVCVCVKWGRRKCADRRWLSSARDGMAAAHPQGFDIHTAGKASTLGRPAQASSGLAPQHTLSTRDPGRIPSQQRPALDTPALRVECPCVSQLSGSQAAHSKPESGSTPVQLRAAARHHNGTQRAGAAEAATAPLQVEINVSEAVQCRGGQQQEPRGTWPALQSRRSCVQQFVATVPTTTAAIALR
jgi:hypothetical protein